MFQNQSICMKNKGLPRSFFNIIGGEFAERNSFYSLAVLTPTFLSVQFGMSQNDSAGVMYLFNTMAYATCVIGGIIADWYLGRYRAVLYFAWMTVLGHILLSVFVGQQSGFLVALFLIAIGTGFIKPNISSLLGDQFTGAQAGDETQLTRAFNWFYFTINAGSVLSFTIAPVLAGMQGIGPAGAYAFPAIMMTLALFLLWTGRARYTITPPTGTPKTTFVGMNIEALKLRFSRPGENPWRLLETKYGVEKVDAMLAVWRVSAFFLFVPLVWSAYHTNGIDWLLDVSSDDVDKTFFGITFKAGQLQTVNPVCILTFIPVSMWMFARIEKRQGRAISTKQKMLLGFILICAAILLQSYVSHQVEAHVRVHAIWHVLAMVILSMGEVLTSISGLQYGYTHAPKSMKSTIGAIWLLTTAIGNALNAGLKSLGAHDPTFRFLQSNTQFYWVLCGLLALNTLVFWLVMGRIKEKIYV
jgi:POT family proton-dependent oligopeptide transporter